MRINPAFFLLPILLLACKPSVEWVQMTNQGPAQGSTYSISYLVPEGVDYREEIDSILKDTDQQMSLWVEQSEISLLNRGDSVAIGEFFTEVILESQLLSELTGGNFDITLAPLIKAWGFSGGKYQDTANVDSLLPYVGYKKLPSPIRGKKFVLPRGFELDVNAVAQGATVDRIANYLRQRGVEHFMVEVGGEVRCLGQNVQGRKWLIGIEKPEAERTEGQFQTIVQLDSMALATSGNYRKFWVDERGMKVVHTIDPVRGVPVVSNLLSVSIIASTALRADAIATAAMVAGANALDLIEDLEDVEGYLIYGNKYGELEVVTTSNWHKFELN
jgi:thiamine biosynthesis lipoprotein